MPGGAEQPPEAFTKRWAMCSWPSLVSATARTKVYSSMRTRVSMSARPLSSVYWKIAAIGDGLLSIRSVICLGKICTARRYPRTLQRHWPEPEKMLVTVNPSGAPVERWHTDSLFRHRVLTEYAKIAPYKAQGFIADWP